MRLCGGIGARRDIQARAARKPKWKGMPTLRRLDRGLVAAHREARRGVCSAGAPRWIRPARHADRAICTACAASPRRSTSMMARTTGRTAHDGYARRCERQSRARAGHLRGRLGSGPGSGRQRQDHAADATLSASSGVGRRAGAHSGADLHAPRRRGDARARDSTRFKPPRSLPARRDFNRQTLGSGGRRTGGTWMLCKSTSNAIPRGCASRPSMRSMPGWRASFPSRRERERG